MQLVRGVGPDIVVFLALGTMLTLLLLLAVGALANADDACGASQLAPANTCWPESPNLKPSAQTDYTKDEATCCALCSNTGGCAGWTWGYDTLGQPGRWSCRLKRAITGTPTTQNCTSGYSGAPPSKKPHILYILAVSGTSSMPLAIALHQSHSALRLLPWLLLACAGRFRLGRC